MSGAAFLADLLRRVTQDMLMNMNVCLPARVVKYDFTEQKADVQPTIRLAYADGRKDEMPVIPGVPVIFPRSGGASMTFPVKPGDTVLVLFADRSIEQWLHAGGVADPGDPRMHALLDAIAIPGLIPFSSGTLAENNEDVLVTYEGNNVRLKPGGFVEVQAPVRVLLDTPLTQSTGDLLVNGNAVVEGNSTVEGNTETLGTTTSVGTILGSGGLAVSAGAGTNSVDGGFSITGGDIEIDGGSVVVTGGDVTADGITLKTHVHPENDMGGPTGLPQ